MSYVGLAAMAIWSQSPDRTANVPSQLGIESTKVFRFALKPIDKVQPWGTEGDLRLHWYGLTDGYYFIEVGEHRILWYSEAACQEQGWDFSATPAGFEFAADYQVVRLLEDIAEILPAILEPVPDDIASILATADSQRAWTELVETWDWQDDTEAALLWLNDRTLDTGYLRAGPRPTFWRVGDTIKLRCDNRNTLLDGVNIWSSTLVEYELPAAEFAAAVEIFAAALLLQMDERTKRVESGWAPKGVRVDSVDLRREHKSRIEQFRAAFSQTRPPTDWAMVRRARNR